MTMLRKAISVFSVTAALRQILAFFVHGTFDKVPRKTHLAIMIFFRSHSVVITAGTPQVEDACSFCSSSTKKQKKSSPNILCPTCKVYVWETLLYIEQVTCIRRGLQCLWATRWLLIHMKSQRILTRKSLKIRPPKTDNVSTRQGKLWPTSGTRWMIRGSPMSVGFTLLAPWKPHPILRC